MKIEIRRDGATRLVVLTKRWALKFPAVHHKGHFWEGLLRGLLANMQERDFCRIQNPLVESFYPTQFMLQTPFALWGGWLNIQPRATPLSEDEWELWAGGGALDDWKQYANEELGFIPPVERKRSSFGWISYEVGLPVRRKLFRELGMPRGKGVTLTRRMRERIVAIDLA